MTVTPLAVVVVVLGLAFGVWLVLWMRSGAGGGAESTEAEGKAASGATPALAAEETPHQAPAAPGEKSWSDGLAQTRSRMIDRLDALFNGRKTIDPALWSELEELLITSDVGVRTALHLLGVVRAAADRQELTDSVRLRELLRLEVERILRAVDGSLLDPDAVDGPLVVLVVGVNGAGKTTTIGKLAARYVAQGKKVLIGAGDTFRAAAVEQVQIWGERAGAEVVAHPEGADPAAVSHDAIAAGLSRSVDVVLCDTAGRLHTKGGLMEELKKVHRVAGKVLDGAPHEVLLVLDATTGQNAIFQAREFSQAVPVTGIVLTKLDGTAKGGVILGVGQELDIPVKLIGIGEAVEDLCDFEPDRFVAALFHGEDTGFGRGSSSADAARADEASGIASDGVTHGTSRN